MLPSLHSKRPCRVTRSAWTPPQAVLSERRRSPQTLVQPQQQRSQPASPATAESNVLPFIRPSSTIPPPAQVQVQPTPPSAIRRAQLKPGEVFMLAYGSNLCWETLSRRDVTVLSRDPAVVRDPSVHLRFTHRGGYASLERLAPGDEPKYKPFKSAHQQRVHGVLYRLKEDDFAKLAKREGGYVSTEMEVETYDGLIVNARVFVSDPLSKLAHEVVPTETYMLKLRDGASDNYLDPMWQAFLSSIETVPSAGLPVEYWDTPAKYISYAFLCCVAVACAALFAQL